MSEYKTIPELVPPNGGIPPDSRQYGLTRAELKRRYEKLCDVLEEIVDPAHGMTKLQREDFLELMISNLECRLEALEEELSNEK